MSGDGTSRLWVDPGFFPWTLGHLCSPWPTNLVLVQGGNRGLSNVGTIAVRLATTYLEGWRSDEDNQEAAWRLHLGTGCCCDPG